MAHYDLNLSLNLACDASQAGLEAVLLHVMPDGTERLIAFAPRTLNKAETNYSQIDKEALAIVWAVKKFNSFSCGLGRGRFGEWGGLGRERFGEGKVWEVCYLGRFV